MGDIDTRRRAILNPLKNLSFFARPAVTEPLEPRPAALRYRGFHLNDWERCVGCSTCQKVCDNAAITMVRVPSLPNDELHGVRNLRPAIDYGRCCWCALCVDLCRPARSACRASTYTLHRRRTLQLFCAARPQRYAQRTLRRGLEQGAENDLIDPVRQPMAELDAGQRIDHFR